MIFLSHLLGISQMIGSRDRLMALIAARFRETSGPQLEILSSATRSAVQEHTTCSHMAYVGMEHEPVHLPSCQRHALCRVHTKAQTKRSIGCVGTSSSCLSSLLWDDLDFSDEETSSVIAAGQGVHCNSRKKNITTALPT